MISKKMNRKFKIKNIMLVSLLVLFVFTCVIGFVSYANEPEIEKVLKSEDYNYLSNSAKEFIRENYELSGDVLLTEKNKEENKPYLNPLYVNYLNMDEEEQESVSYVPAVTVVDFVPIDDVQGDELPQYDLRDYNLVTPNRDQGSLGLCWAFATSSTLETGIMKKTNTTYNADTTQLISERQLDYATSVDGIKDYDNEYVKYVQRKVGSGGNFYISTVALANGISVVDYDWTAYDDTDKEQRELYEVLNYDNSLYEVNGTINTPVFYESNYYDTETLENARLQHINSIKQSIETYGSAVVATYYSDACIHYENGDTNPFLDVTYSCYSSLDGHAMTVIGWNDNYEYSYCADTTQHVDSIEGCTNVVTGKGAWILKNSWGETDANPYLAYTSDYSQFHFVTTLKATEERVWDNNYVIGTNSYSTDSTSSLSNQVRIVEREKLEYIKFITNEIDGEYNIQIKDADGNMSKIYNLTVSDPGLFTLYFEETDIYINNDSEIHISGDSFVDTVSIFTSNITEDISSDFEQYEGFILDNKVQRFYHETKNISAGTELSYQLFDLEGNDLSDSMVVTNNYVAENNVNPLITFEDGIEKGNYELKVQVADTNDLIDTVQVEMPEKYTLPGSGTSDDPYLIANSTDLEQIRYNLDAYYEITNSFSVEDAWRPVGTEDEPFRGAIDGGGYTIEGLTIEADSDDPVAFIAYYLPKYSYDIQTTEYISYEEVSYIRNIIFEKSVVKNTGDAAVLIGKLVYDNTDAPDGALNVEQAIFNIENVHFYDSTVESSNGNAGSLIASIKTVASAFNQPRLNINNSFDSTYIRGYNSSGYIGYSEDSLLSGSGIMLSINISNFQSRSTIEPYDEEYADNLMHSPIIGGIYGNAGISLENFIIQTIFKDVDYYGEFVDSKQEYAIGYYDSTTSNNVSVGKTNGYYVTKFDNSYNSDIYVRATEIKNMTLYEDWADFETYWKILTVDGIQRIPRLSVLDDEVTNIPDINLNVYDKVSLIDYVEGENSFEYVELVESVTGGAVADVSYSMKGAKEEGYYDDISIHALGVGTIKVGIVNHYDGYDSEVTINVTSLEVSSPTITFYKDNDDGEYIQQKVPAGNSFSLIGNTFVKEGYTFENWATIYDRRESSTFYEDEYSFSTGISSDMKLYAVWKGNEYILRFDPNGGTGTMEDKVFTYGNGSTVTISNNLYTKDGYDFKEWNTEPDGSGTKYLNFGSINQSEWLSSEDGVITLYAQWKEKEYSITYNANGGSGSLTPTEGTSGSSVMIKYNIFIKVGKDFNGWNTEADGSGTSYTEGQYITLNSDMTLYAQWVDSFTYSIDDYSEDKTNKYIDLIGLKTSVEDYKKKFTLGTGVTVEVDIGTKSYVYTGSKTKIYRNETLLAEYTNIVRGDINGDGNVSAMDYVKIKNHIMGTNKITDPLLMKATDANQDNKISSMDYVRIKNIIMGGAK